jgi:bifunctional UDP-N-acetylglucosamine pyrophosphorylase / glucosamine-1-phosphate N-acetyltransferase
MDSRWEALKAKGVLFRNPESIELGPEISPDAIAPGAEIHPGCRIRGSQTVILEGARIGEEAPVTIEDCQVGPRVELKGGYCRKSTFLEKANMGSGAHVREACLLEEESNGAHAVGIKQTILMPYVTLGSLVNFCDILMAGGTDRRNHSEVGSSYIHFNFTPNQDKATPSLIGDVPRGVMLREAAIFLGGQGGLVGPSVIGYGSVIAAGIVCREDVGEGKLVFGGSQERKVVDYLPGAYFELERKVRKNLSYIGNLAALRQWYLDVRSRFFAADDLGRALYAGALEKIEMSLDERLTRLRGLANRMPESIRACRRMPAGKASPRLVAQQEEFYRMWGDVEERLRPARKNAGDERAREAFLAQFEKSAGSGYIDSIRQLPEPTRTAGTAWLQGILESLVREALELLPSL